MIHGGALALHIVKKGGIEIQRESAVLVARRGSPVPVGEVMSTGAGTLPFKKIIHAVGPRWPSDENKIPLVEEQLRSAIQNSITLTSASGFKSVALPAVSSGVFGYPKPQCAIAFFDEIMKYAEMKQEKID